MGRPRAPQAAPITRTGSARRARWELTKLIRLLTTPPTAHEATRERLARVAEEVREEVAHVGGSFPDRLAAAYAILDKRPPRPGDRNAAPLSQWVRTHVAALDRERLKRTGTIETTDGPVAHPDYYPVPTDCRDTDGRCVVVPDSELPGLD